jgi:hypothetical protein
MCNKTYCIYATTDTGTTKGKIVYCSFYAVGAILLPERCCIPFLGEDDDILLLTDEVK